MSHGWFPSGTNGNGDGWRLDIVSLLAVIGESSMESHSQALTSSWTCILPRIIPAPQTLLKPTRPIRMPQVNAAVVGVHNGTLVPTLNYFPNIIHPIEELPPFAFRVLKITHKGKKERQEAATLPREKGEDLSSSTSFNPGMLETGTPKPIRRQTTFQKVKIALTRKDARPRVPSRPYSPLNLLAIASFLWTLGLIAWAAAIHDGTAITAVGTISLASSIVGFASWWQPVLMNRTFKAKVPPGDVVIRTREGAFLLVRCDEDVARELYTGTEGCQYYVEKILPYRILVGLGTFLLMVSVVLLGNCGFTMQASIGLSYIVLNGIYWGMSLIKKTLLWDLSLYDCEDVTLDDAKGADANQNENSMEGKPSYTRTLWYAIRETKKIGWVKRGGAAPNTDEWDVWLKLAEENAVGNKRKWNAVEKRENVVGQTELAPDTPISPVASDRAEQHVPAFEIPPPATR